MILETTILTAFLAVTDPKPKLAPVTPPAPVVAPTPAPVPQTRQIAPQPQIRAGGRGYIMPGFNCVVCAKSLAGRGQNGNAGTWKASSSRPWVGAIMIFRPGEQGASGAGHVGVVVGINGNRISLAHCNWGGGQTEFFSTGKFF